MVLTDGVVLLDPFTDADVDAVWAGEDDLFVRRSSLPGPFSRRDITRRVTDWQRPSPGPRRAFALRVSETRRLVGGCVLEKHPDERSAELCYWVYPPYQRRRYATRAVELVCRYAFEAPDMERVELRVEAANSASLRLAEKAGFLRRGGRGHAGRPGMVSFVRHSGTV